MMDATHEWNGQDPTLSSTSQDDFQQFFNMGMNNLTNGLNFDFPEFNVQHNGQVVRDAGDAMDTGLDGNMGFMGSKDAMIQEQLPSMRAVASHGMIAPAPLDIGPANNSLVDLDAQIQYLQQQRHQAQRHLEEQQRQFFSHPSQIIPPTPNSIEMQSGNNHFYPSCDPQQRQMYEQYQMQVNEAEMAFTPLVSPAVTPLDAHFSIPGYTVPGAYFSPLSSPALQAQNEHRSVYDARMSALSTSTSPIDMDLDVTSGPSSKSNSARKAAKKPAKNKVSRSVRQSPIVKPQRRKRNSVTVMPPELTEIIEPSMQPHANLQIHSHDAPRSGPSTEGSEAESISPEYLSEMIMAPPPLPRPGSARNSPYLASRIGQSRVRELGHGEPMSPATPASLMRLAKSNDASPAINHLADHDDQQMEGFSLPEAANPHRPQLALLDTNSDGQTTPTLDRAERTPAIVPLPSPALLAAPSLHSSPRIKSGNSTATTSSTGTPSLRKTPQLAVRGAKKRQSVSSAHVSPALCPKISPSIKPLIKGPFPSPNLVAAMNNISDDTASLLLASKSNYQNILEGTHLPGVSYPLELSTNLTSKRTSHKIAEQGRRNRINSALQEIATLLPTVAGKDGAGSGSGSGEKEEEEKKDAEGRGGLQSANSKASTVELAIDYIKQLKKEIDEANKRAEEAEKELGRLKVIAVEASESTSDE